MISQGFRAYKTVYFRCLTTFPGRLWRGVEPWAPRRWCIGPSIVFGDNNLHSRTTSSGKIWVRSPNSPRLKTRGVSIVLSFAVGPCKHGKARYRGEKTYQPIEKRERNGMYLLKINEPQYYLKQHFSRGGSLSTAATPPCT